MDNPNEHLVSNENPQPVPQSYGSRAILALAIPALGALIIEPLLTSIDSIMVGHLGIEPLAGLAVGAAVMTTMVGVFVFLAYATTATTAQMVGAGNRRGALQSGVDAIWLAGGLAIAAVIILEVTAPWLVTALGARGEVITYATEYLRAGAPGAGGMLLVLAATGTLRGLLDTRTPLIVLAAAAPVNVGANFLFIYGLDMGITGAGVGLSLTQILMAAVLVTLVMRSAAQAGARLRPGRAGIWASAREGLPLFWRTVSLRLALLATLTVAAAAGTAALAAHQVVMSVWSMAAFALDALAIAAQGLVGVAIGAEQRMELRALVKRICLWGLGAGVVIGAVVALTSPWTPALFGSEPQMHQIATLSLLVAGLLLPIGALVFELDGVLIGAGQGKYLAWMGVVTLLSYLPVLALIYWQIQSIPPQTTAQQATALMWIWIAFAGWFMAARCVTNWLRAGKLGA